MSGIKNLLQFEDHWVTDMGAWFQGQRVVFRGEDLFKDLKDKNWMFMLLYGITGRKFNDKQIRLFEGFWTLCTSYPDPRIWNNRVAALAGTVRSSAALSISAANAVSEATIYGRRPDIRSIDFLYRAKKQLDEGNDLLEIIKKELKQYRVILGYGRPVISEDERIKPMISLIRELSFETGEYVKLSFEVEKILLEGRWRMKMNIAALLAALAADQGLSPKEYYQFMILSFSAGMFPCYIDSINKPEGAFFPLRCDRINYEGPNQRRWRKTGGLS
jgi:citrate synthase